MPRDALDSFRALQRISVRDSRGVWNDTVSDRRGVFRRIIDRALRGHDDWDSGCTESLAVSGRQMRKTLEAARAC